MALDCQDADVSLLNIHVVVHAVVRAKEDPAVNGRKGRLIVGGRILRQNNDARLESR